MNRKLIIMMKIPLPGTVKTRLQPFLTVEQSASFATALIKDTRRLAECGDWGTVFAYWPEQPESSLIELTGAGVQTFLQEGAGLGERMFGAFSYIFSGTKSYAVMIGTDCPTLTPGRVQEAFERLEDGEDAVIGPSSDGGFYLLGLSEVSERMFENVEWSSGLTLEQTINNLAALNKTVFLLPELTDIDKPSDLIELHNTLGSDAAVGKHTREWVFAHSQLFETSL